MEPYREEPFTCRVCGMVSHHPEDRKHGYCGNCHEFTGTEIGYIAAVLRQAVGQTGVEMSQVTKALRSIKSTGITLESWRKSLEKAK